MTTDSAHDEGPFAIAVTCAALALGVIAVAAGAGLTAVVFGVAVYLIASNVLAVLAR